MIDLLRRHGPRAAKFAVVGVLNTTLDFAVFLVLLYVVGWPLLVANTVAYLVGLTNSYVLNSRWTFRDAGPPESPARAARYASLNLVGLMLANLTVWLLALVMAPWLAKCGTIGVTFLWNYWSAHRFVFRDPEGLGARASPPA